MRHFNIYLFLLHSYLNKETYQKIQLLKVPVKRPRLIVPYVLRVDFVEVITQYEYTAPVKTGCFSVLVAPDEARVNIQLMFDCRAFPWDFSSFEYHQGL